MAETETRLAIWHRRLKRWGIACLEVVYPPACLVCAAAGPDCWPICLNCRESARRLSEPRCVICCREYESKGDRPLRCANCHDREFAFDQFSTLYHAEGVVRHCVHRLKYDGLRAVLPFLTGWLQEAVDAQPLCEEVFDAVVPVPLHPIREARRGFNQSRLLANALAAHLQCPLKEALIRVENTETQTRFDRRRRIENLRSAFEPSMNESVDHLRLLLVDDIFTTGATMDECARVLRESGAARICAVTVARG